MAEKSTATAKVAVITPSTYTVEEFAAAPKSLGENTSPDIIRAAFKVAGKKEATIEDAKKIVEKYARKEIK